MKTVSRVFWLLMAALLLMLAGTLVSCDSFSFGEEQTEAGQNDFEYYNRNDGYLIKAGASFALTEVAVPATHNGKTVIGLMPSAFREKTTLKSVTLPDTLTQIPNMAFAGCAALESVRIPSGVTEIDVLAFANCTALTSITIPSGVTVLGDGVFDGCTALTTIRFEGTVLEWNAVEKGSNWDIGTGEYTVFCADGEISK